MFETISIFWSLIFENLVPMVLKFWKVKYLLVHYHKKTFHFTGNDNRERPGRSKICSSESWWFKIPQGFSCGLGVPGSRFDDFVPVDCSEVVVKVAKAKSCGNNRKDQVGGDCFNFVNWT